MAKARTNAQKAAALKAKQQEGLKYYKRAIDQDYTGGCTGCGSKASANPMKPGKIPVKKVRR